MALAGPQARNEGRDADRCGAPRRGARLPASRVAIRGDMNQLLNPPLNAKIFRRAERPAEKRFRQKERPAVKRAVRSGPILQFTLLKIVYPAPSTTNTGLPSRIPRT